MKRNLLKNNSSNDDEKFKSDMHGKSNRLINFE